MSNSHETKSGSRKAGLVPGDPPETNSHAYEPQQQDGPVSAVPEEAEDDARVTGTAAGN